LRNEYRKINDNFRYGASTATESEPRPVSVIHGRKEKGGRSPARTTYPVLGLVVPRSGYGHSRLFRFFRAAFQYADDREEREANGAESGDYARRNEKFLLVRGFLEQKDSKEQADQRCQHGNQRNARSEREIAFPYFDQQDDLAGYAVANHAQTDQHEPDEIPGLSEIDENDDQAPDQSDRAHAEHQFGPQAFFPIGVHVALLAHDARDQSDQRSADAGYAAHDAAGNEMSRRPASQQDESPCPCYDRKERGHGLEN